MSDPGRKSDVGKWRFSLFPIDALLDVAKVLEHGARKYAPGNWAKLEDARTRYADAIQRHFFAWAMGETWDWETQEKPGTGERHLACIVCSALFLLALEIRGKIESQPRVPPDWWGRPAGAPPPPKGCEGWTFCPLCSVWCASKEAHSCPRTS